MKLELGEGGQEGGKRGLVIFKFKMFFEILKHAYKIKSNSMSYFLFSASVVCFFFFDSTFKFLQVGNKISNQESWRSGAT